MILIVEWGGKFERSDEIYFSIPERRLKHIYANHKNLVKFHPANGSLSKSWSSRLWHHLLFAKLTLHVPLPLVDLAWLETKALLKFHDLALAPVGVLMKFRQQDITLLFTFSDALLCFLGTFDTMSDDYAWNFEINIEFDLCHRSLANACCLRSLFKKSIDAFIQIIARHIVVNNCPDPRNEYRVFIRGAFHEGYLLELTFLLY